MEWGNLECACRKYEQTRRAREDARRECRLSMIAYQKEGMKRRGGMVSEGSREVKVKVERSRGRKEGYPARL